MREVPGLAAGGGKLRAGRIVKVGYDAPITSPWLRAQAVVLALVLLLSNPLLAAAETIAGRVVDGDTLDIIVDGTATRVRLVNVDSAETFRPHCANELKLGLAAKARLRELLDGGTVTFTTTGRDRWGRTLAYVYVDGQDVGAQLVAEGHALRWSPGPRAKAARLAVWCGGE